MKKDRIAVFDILRTMAVITVVLVHFDGLPLSGRLADVAVDLFFVLSAILVGQPLFEAYKSKLQPNITEFYIKRLTKIIPSYYFFILSGTALAYLFIKPISPENVIDLSELPQYLFFYRNHAGPPPRLTFEHVWSLCVEEQFYIMLPLAFLFAHKRFSGNVKKLSACLAGVALLGILFKIQALYTDIAEWPTYTHNRIDAFAWGLLTLVFLNSRYYKTWVNHKLLHPILILGSLLLLAAFVAFNSSETDPHDLILRSVSPICWSLLIVGAYPVQIKQAGIFNSVAIYSYNLYLWHFLFIIPVAYYLGNGLAGFAVYMGLSLGSAYVATNFIEKRFLKYRAPLLRYLKAKPKQLIATEKPAST